jgi:pimeloyl-ACP methyl ester carboxylesterase
MPKSMNPLWKVLVLVLIGYAGICLLLFFAQRKMIYMPSRARAPLPVGFQPWHLTNHTGGSELWGFKRTNGAAECLFFFHGNGGNASGWSHAVAEFPGDIFVLEYPGYGERPGAPTEQSIKAAALRAFESEHARYKKVVLCGQSLGTGVTEPIFTKYPEKIHALVLITPFLSLAEVASAHYRWLPTRWLLRDRLHLFDSFLRFPGKSLVVTASDDEIIPRSHSLKYLACTNENRCAIDLPATTHNTIELDAAFWNKILSGEQWP